MSDNHDQRSDAAEAMMKKIDDDRAQKDRDQRLTAAKAKSDAAEAMMKKIDDDRAQKDRDQRLTAAKAKSDAAEAMMKKIDDDRAQKDRDQRLTAAKAKSDAAEAMMKKIEEDRVRKEEEQEEEKKQIEQNNHRIEIERKAKVKKEQDAEEEQRRQLIIEEARSVSRKFSGSLYKTRTVHLSERSTLTDPSQASSSSKYVASGPGSTISPNVDAKESVRISAIQNQHSSFSTASKNNASEPTVRMSDVFGKLVMMKIKAKQAKIRTKNHSSKKVAHKLGVRLDRRSGVMLSETAARDLIHAVKLLAASPVNQEWLSTSNAHDGILINNSSTAEALIFTLKDYDYNTNTAQTIVQSIKRVPQELRQEIQKFLNEDELFQLLICFANFDLTKMGCWILKSFGHYSRHSSPQLVCNIFLLQWI